MLSNNLYLENEKVFDYSFLSNQILLALHNIKKSSCLNIKNSKIIKKARVLVENILSGSLINEKNEWNSFSYEQDLFIYDYGSSAVEQINNINDNQEIVDFLNQLIKKIEEVEANKFEHINELESFFQVIHQLLEKDLEEFKYLNLINKDNNIYHHLAGY